MDSLRRHMATFGLPQTQGSCDRWIGIPTISEDAGTSNLVPILGLLADVDGNLWARSHTPWLLRYRDGVLQRSITGELYINVLPCAGRTKARFSLQPQNRARCSTATANLRWSRPLPRCLVLLFLLSRKLPLAIFGRHSRRWSFSAVEREEDAVSKGLPDLKVNCLLPGKDGELWVGTDKGVARWNGSELVPVETGRLLATSPSRRDGERP